MTTLTDKNNAAPIIPTRYIIHPISDSSSNAEVMITAVRTYFEMSNKKSDTTAGFSFFYSFFRFLSF